MAVPVVAGEDSAAVAALEEEAGSAAVVREGDNFETPAHARETRSTRWQPYPETVVEISPDDAAKIGLNGQTTVRVKSRRGEMVARALVTDRVCPGLVFGNFHFPGQQNVNNLTIAALDPISKIPEYKVCAVRIEPV